MATKERLGALGEAARVSAQVAADDREARDREIEEADAVDGMPIREIARATGLAASHVAKVLNRRTAERQAAL